jgi:hypothetical protein
VPVGMLSRQACRENTTQGSTIIALIAKQRLVGDNYFPLQRFNKHVLVSQGDRRVFSAGNAGQAMKVTVR